MRSSASWKNRAGLTVNADSQEPFAKKGFGSWSLQRGSLQCLLNLWVEKTGAGGLSAAPFKDVALHWQQPEPKGSLPAARTLHTCSAVGDAIYVYGGWDGVQYFEDVHAFNCDTLQWTKPHTLSPPPTARIGHTATVFGTRILVFGGHNDSRWFNDLYVLDVATMLWSRPAVKGWAPAARRGHTATLVGNKMYVFGGYNYNARTCCSKVFSDLFSIDTTTMTWEEITLAPHSPTPPGRWNHAAAAIGNILYVFGGGQSSAHFNDLWAFNTETLMWERPNTTGTPPPERGHHSMVSFEHLLVVFGGFDGETNRFNDLHILDTVSMRWWAPTTTGRIPAPRSSHGACFVGTKMVVYGGYGGWINYFEDLYLLDAEPLAEALSVGRPDDTRPPSWRQPLPEGHVATPRTEPWEPVLERDFSTNGDAALSALAQPDLSSDLASVDLDAHPLALVRDALGTVAETREHSMLPQPIRRTGDLLLQLSENPDDLGVRGELAQALSNAGVGANGAAGMVTPATVRRMVAEYGRWRTDVNRVLVPVMARTSRLARALQEALQEEMAALQTHTNLVAQADMWRSHLPSAARFVLHSSSSVLAAQTPAGPPAPEPVPLPTQTSFSSASTPSLRRNLSLRRSAPTDQPDIGPSELGLPPDKAAAVDTMMQELMEQLLPPGGGGGGDGESVMSVGDVSNAVGNLMNSIMNSMQH